MPKPSSAGSSVLIEVVLNDIMKYCPGGLLRYQMMKSDPASQVAFSGELRQLLRFRQKSGEIWLGEHRMILLHGEYLRGLRRELVSTLGPRRAAGAIFRMGFASGEADARLVRSLLPQASLKEVLELGPEMHGLEGLVVGSVDRIEVEEDGSVFDAEASWQSSWESEEPFEPESDAPSVACFSQTGYASGYVSALIGRPAVFQEIACMSSGAPECKIVGRLASAWPEDDPAVAMLKPENLGSELSALSDEVAKLERRLVTRRTQGMLVGASAGFHDALALLDKAASSNISVLLTGETGVGKEVFARWLHASSTRADRPFVAVNCGAIPHDLIESELFGVEAGAFTGAAKSRPGRFERADGGTLMLDELGDLPPMAQVKLLRTLQTGELERLGGSKPIKVDVRIVAATNVDLATEIQDKRFRADLFYRIAAFPVLIPPLRERKSDILLLAEHFLAAAQRRHGRSVSGFSNQASQRMLMYEWPGNVRELENMIERAVLLAPEGEAIALEHLGFAPLPHDEFDAQLNRHGRLRDALAPDAESLQGILTQAGSLEGVERLLIERALLNNNWNVSASARQLGLTRPKLDYRIKRMGIERAD